MLSPTPSILTTAVLFATLCRAVPAEPSITSTPTHKAPISGYGVEDLTWELKAHPDHNKTIRLTGTAQSVIRQLERINPNYHADFAKFSSRLSSRGEYSVVDDANPSQTSAPTPQPSSIDLDGYPWGINGLRCGPDAMSHIGANFWDSSSNELFIGHMLGAPTIGPGPKKCSMVTCYSHSAAWWCNDNDKEYQYGGGFDGVRNAMRYINLFCTKKKNHKGERLVLGQFFNPDNTNVIVAGISAKCDV